LEITPDNLTKAIVKYYKKENFQELKNIVKEWKLEPFLNNKKIFKNVLWAKKSKFTLTVPALTIQVKGIILIILMNKVSITIKKSLKKKYK
jgi:hypothetical protein